MRLSAHLLAFVALISPALHAQDSSWIPTWATAAMTLQENADAARKLPIGRQEVTLRQVVHISQGGKRVRVSLTNELGSTPLTISAAHVAFLSTGSKILTNTDRPLTFHGQASVTIPAGSFVSSDTVVETVPIFSDLVISMTLPEQALPQITYHAAAHTTTYIASGNRVTAEQLDSPLNAPPGLTPPDVAAPVTAPIGEKPIVQSATGPRSETAGSSGLLARTTSWYFLKDVQVDRTRKSAVVVAFGDSITDGTGSTDETNRRWPDVLAPRLATNKKTKAFAIVNEGIGGNRVLHDNAGPSALARFDRDVLNQPGARYVVLLEGINDIGNMHRAPADAITEQQLIHGYTTLANRAHAKGLRFIAATLLPYEGAKYYSADGEQIRQHVNEFVRTSKLFDGCVDFDKVIRDPHHPGAMLPKYDHGDHLHPSDEGYAAMGAAIDLKLFRKR